MNKNQQLLDYIEDTYYTDRIEKDGVFIWSRNDSPCLVDGKEAGHINVRGYMKITIMGKPYFAHRLVYFWCNKSFPEGEIDHIDHNRSNNKIENLRDVSLRDNQKNRGLQSNSKTGVCNLHVRKRKSKGKGGGHLTNWATKICGLDGKRHEKYFPFTDEGKRDAIQHIKDKRIEFGYHPNHGKALT